MQLESTNSDEMKQVEEIVIPHEVSKEFKLSSNRCVRYIIFPEGCGIFLLKKRNVANYLSTSSDGMKFSISISIDYKEDSLTFLVSCKSELNEELDQSKNYKLTAILYNKKSKKVKDARITTREVVLKFPLSLKNIESQICLKIELSIDPPTKYNSRDEVGFTGLINNAATCYMNSVFQILFNLGQFEQLVYSMDLPEHNKFPATLQNLFYNLRHSKASVSTQEIIRSFNWDVDQQAIQQDVQEFIMELLKAIGAKVPEYDDQISELFEGTLENHIKGENFDIVNIEKFMDISLNITHNIIESLNMFVSVEMLEEDNAYNHDEYGKQSAQKYHKFKKLPPILLINLKRYTYQDGGFQKINDSFEYYDTVDFKDFLVNPISQEYTLYAVLVHKGEAINHGHYYCYIKPFYGSKQWFKFDDKIVARASQAEVFDNNFGGTYEDADYESEIEQLITTNKPIPETAYMLVYLKSNQPQILNKPNVFPKWIMDREQSLFNEQQQKKNFISTNIFSIKALNCVDSGIRSGIIQNKQAYNASIDLNEIESFFDQFTSQILIHKGATIKQIINELSQQLQVDQNKLHLLMYRITHLKQNYESVIHLQQNKTLLSYLNQKLHKYALFLVSDDPDIQKMIDEKLEQNQLIKIEQQEKISNGKNSKVNQDKSLFLYFVKFYDGQTTKLQNMILLESKNDNPFIYISEDLQGLKKYYQIDLDLKEEIQILRTTEYQIIYIDSSDTLIQKFQEIKDKKEIIFRVIGEQYCQTQIFNKNSDYNSILQFLSAQEECSPENIQIKYKDKKGNFQIAQETQNLDDMTQYENIITYKQTIVPVGSLKEQMSFEIDNQTYIVQKSKSLEEFMVEENISEKIPVMINKKDSKNAIVIEDRSIKLQRIVTKNYLKFLQPIVIGSPIHIVCYLQSVEIIQLRPPILLQVSSDTTIIDIVKAALMFLQQNPLDYKTQKLTFQEDEILSIDQDRSKVLEMHLRIKINGQEVSQDSNVAIQALEIENNQAIAIITFLTIRDNKNDKLRDKGVQIL